MGVILDHLNGCDRLKLFILLMGNKLCCEETRTHGQLEGKHAQLINQPIVESNHHHKPAQNSNHAVTEKPQQNTHVPELAADVAARIHSKKFFEHELHNQTRAETRRYGADVYVGTLDQNGHAPHGFGRMYKEDKSHYIGHFNRGKAEGQGVYLFPDGSYYFGQFHNNHAQSANGQYYSQTIQYRGGFSNNVFEGEGYEQGRNYVYKGHFHNGARTKGLLKWSTSNNNYDYGHSYDGEFNYYNQFHGKGVLQQPEGTYSGDFQNGQKHGHGVYHSINGSKYEGSYEHGVRQGRGTIYHKDGSVAYTGQIRHGVPHGRGKAPGSDGKLVETEWIEGIDKTDLTA